MHGHWTLPHKSSLVQLSIFYLSSLAADTDFPLMQHSPVNMGGFSGDIQIFIFDNRVSPNSPTCIKTLVGVRVPVPISEQAEKPKKMSFHAFLSRGHHFLRLQRNFSKIQRKICRRTIFALIWGRMLEFIYRLHQIATFLSVFPKTPIIAILDSITAIWLYGYLTP